MTTGTEQTIMLEQSRKLKDKGSRIKKAWAEMNRMISALGGSGSLSPDDIAEFTHAESVALELMMPGEAMSEDEIMAGMVAKGIKMRSSAVMRRVRHLRPTLNKIGWTIAAKKSDLPGRVWTYRLQKLQEELPLGA